MKRHNILAWTAVAVALSWSNAAFACPAGNVQFNDQFSSIDTAWPYLTAPIAKIDGGHLLLDVGSQQGPADGSYAAHSLNQTNIYADSTVCMDFTFGDTKDQSNTALGIAFWGTDDSAYYVFEVAPNGYYEVSRKVNDSRWLTPLSWTTTPLIKKEPNAPQEIMITTKGNVASLFINGTKVGDVKGQMPSGGGSIGIYYSVPNTGGAKFTISQIQVTS